MLFSLKVEKERLNERRKKGKVEGEILVPEEKGQEEQEERGKGKGRGLEKERERNVVVLSLLSQAQVIFKVFPC